jgi:glycosyltransferase involved in cell wall biosynthesis
LDIIREYGKRIDIVISESDIGIYDAMNKGTRIATGDYLGILNSDDIFSHTLVISDIARILSETKADAIYGDLVIVNRENTSKIIRSYSSRYFKKWKVRFGLMFPHPTFYVKRSLFEEFGFYKLSYRVSADFELITRFLCKGIICVRNPDVMVKMRQGGISSNGFWWRIHQNLEIIRACKENGIYTNIFLIAFKLPIKLLSYIK